MSETFVVVGGETTVPELRAAEPADAMPFSPVWAPVLTAATVLGGRLE